MPANVGDPSRALTVMCPVHPDKVESLKDCLHALKRGEEGPLATGTTHLGRWVVIEQIDDKDGDPTSDRLSSPYLLFSSNLDGDVEAYLGTLCDSKEASGEVRRIWGHCVGYPADDDSDSLVAYLLHNRIRTNFFFTPYPEATVEDIRHSLGLRKRFIDFAVRAQTMDAETIMRSFRDQFKELTP